MINNSRYKRKAVSTTASLLLPESKKRKSVLISNIHSSASLYIGNSANFYADGEYKTVSPNSSIELEIPKDNPREPIYGRGSTTFTVEMIEQYSKEY